MQHTVSCASRLLRPAVLLLLMITRVASAIRIDVTVRRALDAPAAVAARSWVDYQWQQGGGLAGVYVKELTSSPAGNPRRQVWPLLLEETLTREPSSDEADDAGCVSLEYAVTGAGLMGDDLVPGSHRGLVRFDDKGGAGERSQGCEMTWEVSFEVTEARHLLWRRLTEFTIGEASDNIVSFVATPLVLQTSCQLPSTSAHPVAARDDWLEFIWYRGGGLPLPPPILRTPKGAGCERLLIPPGLRERVESLEGGREGEEGEEEEEEDGGGAAGAAGAAQEASVSYRVVNPGPFTYQASAHRGRVRFSRRTSSGRDGGGGEHQPLEIRWLVAVRPLPRCAWLVKPFTQLIVGALARNLAAQIESTAEMEGANSNTADESAAIEQSWRVGAAEGDEEAQALIDSL